MTTETTITTPVTPPVTLSALIRRGAAMPQVKQTYRAFHRGYGEGGTVAVCVLGAAMFALTGEPPMTNLDALLTLLSLALGGKGLQQTAPFPLLSEQHPAGQRLDLLNAVMALNDEFHWTFAQIATWLEGNNL